MEREKILAALLEHLDPALPEVVLTCDFHLHGQIDFLFTFSQFKLVFCHEIKRDRATHFVWTDCPSCYGSSLSAGFFFFFLLPPLLPLHKLCKLPSLGVC